VAEYAKIKLAARQVLSFSALTTSLDDYHEKRAAAPAEKLMFQVGPVVRFQQHGVDVYSFRLTAEQVVAMCKIERFGEDVEGVNRKYDHDHALDISQAMLKPENLWLDAILGDLKGPWTYDQSTCSLAYDPSQCFVSVDDGQHRVMALSVLHEAERAHLAFNLTVTMSLSYKQRLRVFAMQAERKPIDARMTMAIKHELDTWASALDREAYEVVMRLNSDTCSPLKGKILLEEQETRIYERRHRPVGINGKGLHTTIRRVIGRTSPIGALTPQRRAEIILAMIKMAKDVWPKAWGSENHILETARGVNAVLQLIISSPNFMSIVGEDLSQENIRRALAHAESYDWSIAHNKNVSILEMVHRINQSIGRNRHKKAAKATPAPDETQTEAA
jgi:DGQHR domain-containing protein